MNDYNLIIGSHVKMAGPDYYLGSVKEAISYGANTFMFYTGAPQNSRRVPTEKCHINEAVDLAIENNINMDNVICHAPYLINLGNIVNNETFELSKQMLKTELKRCCDFKSKILVLHPGSSLGEDRVLCLDQIAFAINEILEDDNSGVLIALETMAGKGNELCKNFDEMAYVLKKIVKKERIGVCLDTCHINDAGYDLSNFDSIINEFDEKIGIEKLKVIHVNDSKNPINSHKDRHENIGYGTIGFDKLLNVIYSPKLNGIPKILETPYINGLPPYKSEIEMIKSKKFNNSLK